MTFTTPSIWYKEHWGVHDYPSTSHTPYKKTTTFSFASKRLSLPEVYHVACFITSTHVFFCLSKVGYHILSKGILDIPLPCNIFGPSWATLSHSQDRWDMWYPQLRVYPGVSSQPDMSVKPPKEGTKPPHLTSFGCPFDTKEQMSKQPKFQGWALVAVSFFFICH